MGTPKKALQRSIRHRLTALGVICMPSFGHFWGHFCSFFGHFSHFGVILGSLLGLLVVLVAVVGWWARTKECGGFKKYFSPLSSQMLYWSGENHNTDSRKAYETSGP